MKLTVEEVKQVFLNVIEEKISFEEASMWATEMMKLEELEQLECDDQDLSKIFSGLTYLLGIDLMYTPGEPVKHIPTTKGIIHYAKDGSMHMVPSNPTSIID